MLFLKAKSKIGLLSLTFAIAENCLYLSNCACSQHSPPSHRKNDQNTFSTLGNINLSQVTVKKGLKEKLQRWDRLS